MNYTKDINNHLRGLMAENIYFMPDDTKENGKIT